MGNKGATIAVTAVLVISVVAMTATVSAAGSTAVSLSPSTADIDVSQTKTFDIVVENADGGVGAYTATVSLSDASVANITDVTLKGSPDLKSVTFASDNSSVTIDSSLMDTNNTGAVTIATVTVKAETSGSTDVELTVSALGDEGGTDYTVTGTNNATLSAGNVAPTASFTVNTTKPEVGETVMLNASGSSDTDGSISSYEWDLDGDGNYDEATGKTTTTSFDSAGDKTVGLRVTDNEGKTDTTSQTITVVRPALTLISGSVDPATVDESTTVTHNVGALYENVSQDGNTDRFYFTFSNALAGNLSANSANATNANTGSSVSISSSKTIVDGPDKDGVMETITFAIQPDGSGPIDVIANVSVDVTWPAVDSNTTYSIRAAAEDSTTGNVSLTQIADVTVVDIFVIGNFSNPPTDPDGDGLYEDINGNGEANIVDVQAMFVNRDDSVLTSHPDSFDFSGNGEVDIVDIQALFAELSS